LPSYRMSGLTSEQLDEIVARAEDFLEEPWDKDSGRPKGLSLRDAIIVTCGYMRNNITEEVWAEIFGVSQSCVSRYIKLLTPVVADAMKDERPTSGEATEAARGTIVLVDGTLWPCWSWSGAKDLWAGKYKTTGHGSLVISNYDGDIIYVSDPVTGNRHDMGKLSDSESEKILKAAGGVFGDKGFIGTDYITTPVRKPKHRELYIREKEYNADVSSHRAPVERAVAQLKTWRILFTDYRRPLETFKDSFRAAIGLYFFKLNFA
jgi:DDE superfamily endonuclease/Helix-turn-helix of DDE superfamily endonuclease